MGKKAKLGKRRKDRFYQLAKETGFRARSAFKLIQLNRKFQFLQQSRVLVDLCAAPGGWLQVAAKHMPVSSIIIGVDLVPIRPIHNVVTIQADITTSQCKQLIHKELKDWKVDCILNDGAPNVGSAWIQDAFSQAHLTLSALKLACEFLKPGGWFVTKVFRSKDYQPLMNTFQQLFKKVHATKPQASRNESAEIFVVCKGYLIKGGKPDPKLLDFKCVFEEKEEAEKPKLNLQKIQKASKSAKGYGDDQNVLYQSISVADFVTSEDHMTLLAEVHKLEFDRKSEVFAKHPLTTEDILLSCEDVKVLGLRELKLLIKWREKMRMFLDEAGGSDKDEGMEIERNSDEENEQILKEMEQKVEDLAKEEKAEVKRLLRLKRKQRKKFRERQEAQKNTHTETDELISNHQGKMFSMKSIGSKKQLNEVESGQMNQDDDDDDDEVIPAVHLVDKDREHLDVESSGDEGAGEGAESEEYGATLEWESDDSASSEDGDKSDHEDNPLVVQLEDEAKRRGRKTSSWFNNPLFQGMEIERDEEEEIQSTIKKVKLKGQEIIGEKTAATAESAHDDTSDSDSDYDDLRDLLRTSTGEGGKGGSFEVVPMEEVPTRGLNPEGLAMGALMVQSRKKQQELMESGYNRWTHTDADNLPDWFVEDENQHYQKQLPITKEMVEEYRKKLREINARPIKKIAEAKARKKYKAAKKLEAVRQKAQVICDNVDASDREKAQQIKSVYKKAGLMGAKKREVKYVVAKKGMGKRAHRPAGVSGHYKVVDPRMKKDKRAQHQKGQHQKRRTSGKRKRS